MKQFASNHSQNMNNKNKNYFRYFKNRLGMKFHVLLQYCRRSTTNSQLPTQSSRSCLLLVVYSPSGTALFIQPPEEADECRMVYGELQRRAINLMYLLKDRNNDLLLVLLAESQKQRCVISPKKNQYFYLRQYFWTISIFSRY